MTDVTPRLSLPLILPAQAQKHVTHNEALRLLDTVAQLVLEGVGATTPPGTAAEGAVWALGPAPTGAWAGEGGKLALRVETGWMFLAPREGWIAWDRGTASLWVRGAAGWMRPAQDNVPGLGIGTAHDATNRLAVVSEATLLTHAGAGHQVKINKAGASETASLLFQSGWSGRAEMGLAGSEDFAIKVSADGTAWTEALRLDRADGRMRLTGALALGPGTAAAPALAFDGDEDTGVLRPGADRLALATGGVQRMEVTTATVQVNLPVTGTAVTQGATDTTAGRLLKVGDFGLGAAAGVFSANIDTITVNGFYRLSTGAVSTASPTPSLGAGQYLIHYNWDVNAAHQVLYTLGADRPSSYERTKISNVWGHWRRVFNAGNILGPVSQSGGIPTGRMFETGSNANGRFLRLPDGTQFCWSGALTLSTNPSDNAMLSAPWTFPAAFSEAPNVMATLSVNSGVFSGFGSLTVSQIRQLLGAPTAQNSVSTTICELLVCFGQLAPVGAQMTGQRAFAVGRWF